MKLAVLLILVALLGFGCVGSQLEEPVYSGSSPSELQLAAPLAPFAAEKSDTTYVTKDSFITIKVPEGTLQTKFDSMKDMLRSNGAQMTDIRYYEYTDRKEYSLTIKVPPAKFDRINSLLQEVGEVKDLSVSLEDVTQQYVDLDTRIRNKEVELERLYGIYNESNKVSDLLEVEREVTRVETELELLKQQKQYLVSRIELSTITITLYEEKPATQQLASLEGLGSLFLGAVAVAITLMVAVLGFLLPIAIVIVVLWFVYKKLKGEKTKPRKSEHDQIPPPR